MTLRIDRIHRLHRIHIIHRIQRIHRIHDTQNTQNTRYAESHDTENTQRLKGPGWGIQDTEDFASKEGIFWCLVGTSVSKGMKWIKHTWH